MIDQDKQQIADAKHLSAQPEFQRFLFRVIQSARILSPTTDGSVDRHLAYDEGRRHLGLEILSMVEAGQPVPHPDGQPILTLIQVLREEANSQPQENANGRRNQYDRHRELAGVDDGDD